MNKVAIYKERIYKTAAEQLLDKEQVRKLLRGEKRHNYAPRPETLKGRMTQKENFAFNAKVKTKLDPDLKLIAGNRENSPGYVTKSTGFGRQNQFLEAYQGYKNRLLGAESKDRREVADNAEAANKKGNVLIAASLLPLIAGGIAGKKIFRGTGSGAASNVIAGIGLGAPITAGMVALADRVKRKSFYKNLTSEQRKKLLKIVENDADEISQNASSASRVLARNYYYY